MREADLLLTRYRSMFDIAVEHRYFADSHCRDVHWHPHDDTADLLKRSLCIWRPTSRGLSMYADVSHTRLLKDSLIATTPPFSLGLSILATDPYFRQYTGGMGGDADAVFTFDAKDGVREDDGRIRLHAAECITHSDRMTRPGAPTMLDQKTVPRIDIRLVVDVSALEYNAHAPETDGARYYIRFAARETFWQYNIVCDGSSDEFSVIDAGNKINFDACGPRRLANGRVAQTFRSKTAIPLQEMSPQRFQLQQQEQNLERVIVKRLPVASAGQLSMEEQDGAPRWISEIYVHC
ncbi:MAG: hypothetical protein ACKO1K_06000 [Burkholderiales bacterium]